ncbi:hypothetical protein J4221_02485 [Candidatus Pacearchaeota archaeon]|nr:hypothetical protein [Candidatus Pacearchaeota archaeon]
MNDVTKLLKKNYINISKFSSKDEEEFYKFLKKSDINNKAFENNWPYILQATRNRHYKFYYRDSIVFFTLRFKKSNKNFIVVVNFLGKERNEAVLELCNILKKNNINVLIKNIDKKEIYFWKKQGFIESIKPWSRYSFRDDNTFPQHILSRDIIKLRTFSRGYMRLFRKFEKENIITESYKTKNDFLTNELLHKNANFLYAKGVDKKEEVIGAHLFFFDNNVKNKIRLQHIRNKKLIGVSYLTLINDVAFGNALFCKKEKDIMKYLAYEGMMYVINNYQKIKFFSIQGSENKGQNFFKKRFNPIISIEKTHLILS